MGRTEGACGQWCDDDEEEDEEEKEKEEDDEEGWEWCGLEGERELHGSKYRYVVAGSGVIYGSPVI